MSECNSINNRDNITDINQPNEQEVGRLVDYFLGRKRKDNRRLGIPRTKLMSYFSSVLEQYEQAEIIKAIEASDFYVIPEKVSIALRNLPTREQLAEKRKFNKKQQSVLAQTPVTSEIKPYGALRAAFGQIKAGNNNFLLRERFTSRKIDVEKYDSFDDIPQELLRR